MGKQVFLVTEERVPIMDLQNLGTVPQIKRYFPEHGGMEIYLLHELKCSLMWVANAYNLVGR